jgi:serine protease
LKARFFAAAAASAALLAACSGGGSTIVPSQNNNNGTSQAPAASGEFRVVSTFSAQNNATGDLVRIFPTKGVLDALRASDTGRRTLSGTNLTYHGGPVQTAPKIYVVYWGNAWNGSGDPNGERSYYNSFISLVGGSRWLNSVTQYTQSNGSHVGNASGSFVGSYIDTGSTPPSAPTQSQIANEAARAAAHYNDYSASASYIVALPHGIVPSGFGTQYCAWHSAATVTGKGTIAYTNLPYMSDVGYSCGVGSVNSPGTLDGVSIVGGHEQGETETDPQPNTGWVDLTNNSENGDKCAWTGLQDNPYVGNYPTQPLWSNATSSCVQSY